MNPFDLKSAILAKHATARGIGPLSNRTDFCQRVPI